MLLRLVPIRTLVPLLLLALMGAGVYIAYSHPSANAGGIHHVRLTATGADPATLLIKAGESVQFDAADGARHNIASGVGDGDGEAHAHDANGVESGEFAADEGYLVQFKKAGSYYFHDHLNPVINISIAVYDPALK